MEETSKQDYYKVGSRDSIVISNSSLTYINSEQGGSPQAFLNFFDEKIEEKESKSLRMGKLIHLWAEDRENFRISSVAKPTEKMGEIADKCILEILLNGVDFTRQMASDISEILGYDKRLTPAVRLQKVYDAISPYVLEFLDAQEIGQVYLTDKEAEVIEKSVAAVENHPVAKELLFMQDNDFSNKKTFKELEIYWKKRFTGTYAGQDYDEEVLFKAKLDDVTIDYDAMTVAANDPKTSVGGAYSFGKAFENYRYYRQAAFYRWAITEWLKQQNLDPKMFTFTFRNIVIETNNLFQCVVWNVGAQWLLKGQKEYQLLVKRVVEHIVTNQWNYSKEEFENNLIIEIPFKEEVI